MKFRRIVTLITVGAMLAGSGVVAVMAAEKTTKEQAQEIALADAGLKETEVTFDDIEKDNTRGTSVYEIGFRTDSAEYEYEIALADGEIVSSGRELEDRAAGGKEISEKDAKGIALADAGVVESKMTFTTARSVTKNGTAVYEFKFEDAAKEYEYEISKEGGVILDCSMKVKTPASAAAVKK